MWAHSLKPIHYQLLINRGWRRSGQYIYKPINDKTCCPSYTIRCNALEFHPTKSQRKALSKVKRFLQTGKVPGEKRDSIQQTAGDQSDLIECPHDVQMTEVPQSLPSFSDTNEPIPQTSNVIGPSSPKREKADDKCDNSSAKRISLEDSKPNDSPKSQSNCQKAKTIRIERKLKKIMNQHRCDENEAQRIMKEEYEKKKAAYLSKHRTKSLESLLNDLQESGQSKHKLRITFVSTSNDECVSTLSKSLEVYQKYQIAIHRDTPEKCSKKQFQRFLVNTPIRREQFKNLPSNSETQGNQNLEKISWLDRIPNHFASYHQQYWIDDDLVAVGVLDILPHCVSSVYLFYDPKYHFLSLGTFSALVEIALTRQLHQKVPSLRYYYMGFYIHSCPKMRYKGKYRPSELLCPEAYTWHPIEQCTPKLDVNKYSRFNDDPAQMDVDGEEVDQANVGVLHQSTVMTYGIYKMLYKREEEEDDAQVHEYASLVGKKCSKEMLLYRE